MLRGQRCLSTPAAPGGAPTSGPGTAGLRTTACPTSSPESKLPSEQRAASLGGTHSSQVGGGGGRDSEGGAASDHNRAPASRGHLNIHLSSFCHLGIESTGQTRDSCTSPRVLAELQPPQGLHSREGLNMPLVSLHPDSILTRGRQTALSKSAKATSHTHSPPCRAP